jgi:hypothetical protein
MTPERPIELGTRLELLVDDPLVAGTRAAAALRLHHPVPAEAALVTDRPWEGSMCSYVTVFQDGDLCRMYYKAWEADLSTGRMVEPHELTIAYAESPDGKHWTRPELRLFEFNGSRANNIVWCGQNGADPKGTHGFSPFKDANPACAPEARYKAVGAGLRHTEKGLYAMASPDGIHWSLIQPDPIITQGAFDSQNLAFWDSVRGQYRAYVRDFRDDRRAIRTATSPDFVNWTEPESLDYPGAPDEQLYTNQVIPYYRAPHIFVGFPTRYVERPWSASIEALPELEHRRMRSAASLRYGTALSDGLLMTSRDGRTFRRWGEAFIRPGPQLKGNWTYGDNYQNWGLVETESDRPGAPREISIYASENYWRDGRTVHRRHTLRVDGFVSMHAPLAGGEFTTRPLTFGGDRLVLNLSTSAAGSIRAEVQDAAGRPLDGLRLADCPEFIGDRLDYEAHWNGGRGVGGLKGRPVRLRFVLRDADLYSFRFAPG